MPGDLERLEPATYAFASWQRSLEGTVGIQHRDRGSAPAECQPAICLQPLLSVSTTLAPAHANKAPTLSQVTRVVRRNQRRPGYRALQDMSTHSHAVNTVPIVLAESHQSGFTLLGRGCAVALKVLCLLQCLSALIPADVVRCSLGLQ
jgi:hypothetical protein